MNWNEALFLELPSRRSFNPRAISPVESVMRITKQQAGTHTLNEKVAMHMSFRSLSMLFAAIPALSIFMACSDPEADFASVQQTLDASAASFRETQDPAAKIASCNAAITALRNFLERHKDGELGHRADQELAMWELRKSVLEHRPANPLEELSGELKHQAIQEAARQYPAARISEVRREGQTSSKAADTLRVAEVYAITMLGENGHRSITTVHIHTSGRIALNSKQVFVDEYVSARR